MRDLSDSSAFPFPQSAPFYPPSDVEYSRHAQRPPISFRRISLPTVPSLSSRSAVTSIASVNDVIPEDGPLPEFLDQIARPRSSMDPSPPLVNGAKNAQSRSPRARVPRRHSKTPDSFDEEGREKRAAKRMRVVNEIWQTEKAYMDGLNLIYEHFLVPLITSLERPSTRPIITRDDIMAIFSNFVDIWNLHRSILSSLSEVMSESTTTPPAISSILMSHFPYLSLYKPFITNFPSSLSTITHLQSTSSMFASWLGEKERDKRCQSLSLVSWLLTCVQRVPRYLLLVKDLIASTDSSDGEAEQLRHVFSMLSKTANTLNTALSTHSLTLSVLALQRSCTNLAFPLIAPGRRLLKRGSLFKEGPKGKEPREFLLFSDCLVYFSRQTDEKWLSRPPLERRRSKSDNIVRRPMSGVEGVVDSEKWRFHMKIELQDVTVIGKSDGAEPGQGSTKLEILSPQESFAVYAATASECSAWLEAIREAKVLLLSSLQTLGRPLSTLTSSTSTRSLRLALQALPIESERRRVDHYVPAVWVPDRKAQSCMRCGGAWGMLRWKHHCRLCGSVVCAACSNKTFYIANPTTVSGIQERKAARACNTCYDAVFPKVPPCEAETDEDHLRGGPGRETPDLPEQRLSTVTIDSYFGTPRPITPINDFGAPGSLSQTPGQELDSAMPELTTTLLELGVSPFANALKRTEVQRLEVMAKLRMADAAPSGAGKPGGKAASRLNFVLSQADRRKSAV